MGAIVVSSVIFGVGHLPLAFLIYPEAGIGLTVYIIVANSLFGFIAGFLYWKKGLEAAIIAHVMAHVVMLAANYLGLFF